jgi:hypothetical protein
MNTIEYIKTNDCWSNAICISDAWPVTLW